MDEKELRDKSLKASQELRIIKNPNVPRQLREVFFSWQKKRKKFLIHLIHLISNKNPND